LTIDFPYEFGSPRMNLDSKYYDPIRRSRAAPQEEDAAHEAHAARCAWEGCLKPAAHRAPLTARQLRHARGVAPRWLCAEHIGPFNRSFNFFEGLSDTAASQWEQDALTGHRPTWRRHGSKNPGSWAHLFDAADAALRDILDRDAARPRAHAERTPPPRTPPVTAGQRRALDTLNLPADASLTMLTERYKQLLKRYHPDCNGGARLYEQELARTLNAYHYLKASGFGRAA